MNSPCSLEETFLSIKASEYKIYSNFEVPIQCEICYNSQSCNLFNGLTTTFEGTTLSDMLDYFPALKEYRLIEASLNLCLTCLEQLVSSYLFLNKILKSNEKFKGLVKSKFSNVDQHIKEKPYLNQGLNITENERKEFLKENNCKEGRLDTESLGTATDCKSRDNVLVKHKGVTHDHSYIQNSVHTSDEISNTDEVQSTELSPEEKKQLKCEICHSTFARQQNLSYHMRRIHLNEKTFLCSTCGKQFFLKIDYNRHILLHRGEAGHKCTLCKKGFVTSGLLKNHIRTVHKNKEIKCSYCTKKFKLQTQLKRHIMGVHKKKGNLAKEKVNCNICGKRLTKQCLNAHMERHSGTKRFQCDVCGQKFFQHLSLNNHMIRHQDPKFSCEYCGKSHFTKQEMLTHIRRQHTREIVCTCQHCGKGFVHKTNLIQHVRYCHPGDNEPKLVEPKTPKQCTVCGKIYSSRTSLIHHRRRAHENKEYPCSECEMTFRNLVPFKSHLKKVHNIGETYNCDTCSKTFYTRDDLYKHKKRIHQVKVNSWYLCCTVCNVEKFKTKHELIQHMHSEHLKEAVVSPILYECNSCVTFFINFEVFHKHLVRIHPDKTDEEVDILEYEIGSCKVQYFHNKTNIEHR